MIKSKIRSKSRINAWAVASLNLNPNLNHLPNLNPPLYLNPLPTAAESRTLIVTGRSGLSRVDVVVMLLIVILAAGLGTFFLIRQYQNAARAHCAFNLERLGKGVRNFHDANFKRLPPARIADGYATWVVLIAKYLPKKDPAAADNPLNGWDVSKPYVEQTSEIRQARLAEMHCPSYPRPGPLSVQGDVDAQNELLAGAVGDYACVSGDGWTDATGPNDNGPMTLGDVLEKKDGQILQWRGRYSFDDLRRGTSSTLLLGEKHVPLPAMALAQRGDGCVYNGQYPASSARVAGVGFGLRTAPDALLPRNFGGYHEDLCQFLMADLSLNPLSLHVSERVLGEMATRVFEPRPEQKSE